MHPAIRAIQEEQEVSEHSEKVSGGKRYTLSNKTLTNLAQIEELRAIKAKSKARKASKKQDGDTPHDRLSSLQLEDALPVAPKRRGRPRKNPDPLVPIIGPM